MDRVIHNLREKSILHRDQVQQIKQYIDVKYSDATSSHKATIFAKAVHQVVDESVRRFEEKYRIQIRTEVLKSAIVKDLFEINGYDVFEVCATIPIEDDAKSKDKFYANLTQWVNENQEEEVTRDMVQSMAVSILDQTVSSLVDMLEESILVDKDIIEMNHHDKREVIKERLSRSDEKVNTPISSSAQLPDEGFSMNNELEDFVSDGRFMDTEGEPVDLSSEDIERALSGEFVAEEIVVEAKSEDTISEDTIVEDTIVEDFEAEKVKVITSDVIDTVYSALGPRNEKVSKPLDKVDELSQDKDDSQASIDQISNVIYSNEGEGVFDSMDLVFDESLEDEKLEEATSAGDLGSVDDEGWEDADLTGPKRVKNTRLKGYELNPPKQSKVEKEPMPQNYRLMLILPVVMILIMLFIVLIVGAIQISRQVSMDGPKLASNVEIQVFEGDDGREILDLSPLGVKTLRKIYLNDGLETDKNVHLHKDLQYRPINSDKLKGYLDANNSILSEDIYIEGFLASSQSL